MAALTWQAVANPNFGSGNEMFRTAGVSLDRAFAGINDALKGFRTERAATQGNQLLAKSLGISDQNALQQQLADGSFFAGTDLSTIDPRILQQVGARGSELLDQAAQKQSMASQKQTMDSNLYAQNRLVGQNTINDNARAQVAKQLNLSGPAADLAIEAQQALAKTTSGLQTDVLNRQGISLSNQGKSLSNSAQSFNNSTAVRDDAARQDAYAAVDDITRYNATVDDQRSGFLETEFSSPQAAAMGRELLEKTTGAPIFTPLAGATAPTAAKSGGGKSSSGSKGKPAAGSDGASSMGAGAQDLNAQLALGELGRTQAQGNSTGTVADIEKNLNDTRNSGEISKEISLNYAGANQGKINAMIDRARSDYPNLSAADIGSALSRSTSGGFFGTTSIADGVGVDDQSFVANLNKLNSGKMDYMSEANKRVRSVATGITKADKKLADAKAELNSLFGRAESQPGIDTSKAEAKVDKYQEALDAAIADYQNNPVLKPAYKPAPTKADYRRPERGRAAKQRNQ